MIEFYFVTKNKMPWEDRVSRAAVDGEIWQKKKYRKNDGEWENNS